MVETVSKMTVEEAARNLVVKEVSVRMRVGRGKCALEIEYGRL